MLGLRFFAQASLVAGFSYCRLLALDCWAQYLWPLGLAALQHVGYSRNRDQNCVPCIGQGSPQQTLDCVKIHRVNKPVTLINKLQRGKKEEEEI